MSDVIKELLTFDNDSGLSTASKTEILETLKTMTKEAFGTDFAVEQGTAWYNFIDSLSNSLNTMCSAAKDLYNAQGIINAYGANLDNSVSLAGIYRKEDEADEQLRYRAIRSIYSNATSVTSSIESSLMNIKLSDGTEPITYAKVINNSTSDPMTVDSIQIPAHCIWTIVNSSIDIDTSTELKQAIAKVIFEHKTLGCGTSNTGLTGSDIPDYAVTYVHDDVTYTIKFSGVVQRTVYATVALSVTNNQLILSTEDLAKLKATIQKDLITYINTLNIGEDVLINRLMAVINKSDVYEDFVFDVNSIKVSNSAITSSTTANVKLVTPAYVRQITTERTGDTYDDTLPIKITTV